MFDFDGLPDGLESGSKIEGHPPDDEMSGQPPGSTKCMPDTPSNSDPTCMPQSQEVKEDDKAVIILSCGSETEGHPSDDKRSGEPPDSTECMPDTASNSDPTCVPQSQEVKEDDKVQIETFIAGFADKLTWADAVELQGRQQAQQAHLRVIAGSKLDLSNDAVKAQQGFRDPQHGESVPPCWQSGLFRATGVQAQMQSWENAAEDLVKMCFEFRDSDESAGGGLWMRGMRELFKEDSDPCSSCSFDELAGSLLEKNAVLAFYCTKHPWHAEYLALFLRLEAMVVNATKNLKLEWDWTWGALGVSSWTRAQKQGQSLDPDAHPFGGFSIFKRSWLFVGLPLAVFLSDNPRVGDLMRCFQSIAVTQRHEEARQALGNVDREFLFLILVAMQALYIARPVPKNPVSRSLNSLAATIVCGEAAGGYVSVAGDGSRNQATSVATTASRGKLIFHGMWVPAGDAEDNGLSWCFDLFSWSLMAVLHMLSLQTCVVDNDAPASHMVLYLARFEAKGCLAFPMQLFSQSTDAEFKQELLVPPFVRYSFEGGCCRDGKLWQEVSSALPQAERDARLSEVEERWGLSLSQEAPLVADLLNGDVPQHLESLHGMIQKVTVRFVSNMELAPAMQQIFSSRHLPPEKLLLAFPPVGNEVINWTPYGCGMTAVQDKFYQKANAVTQVSEASGHQVQQFQQKRITTGHTDRRETKLAGSVVGAEKAADASAMASEHIILADVRHTSEYSALVQQALQISRKSFEENYGALSELNDLSPGIDMALLVDSTQSTTLGYLAYELQTGPDGIPWGFKLFQLAVNDSFRGKGFGSKLVSWAITRAKGWYLDALHVRSLKTAMHFYRKLGFGPKPRGKCDLDSVELEMKLK